MAATSVTGLSTGLITPNTLTSSNAGLFATDPLVSGGTPTVISPAAPAAATATAPVPGSGPSGAAAITAPVAAVAAAAPAAIPAAAAAAPVPALVPTVAIVPPAMGPAPLAPSPKYAGTPTASATYSLFSSQFSIDLDRLNHLLKLANPSKYGRIYGTDQFGKTFEVSGVRRNDSFGNNLSNAGADQVYGTPDDIKPGQAGYKTNSQGIGAEFWANADTPFLRLSQPEWGTNGGSEEPGRPRGYTGAIGVDQTLKLVEPTNQALANSRLVSNALGAQNTPVLNTGKWNVYDMSFGQYFDHGLDFIARSGVGQSIASATTPTDPLNKVSGGAVGVVGDRGGQFVLDPSTNTMVQVARFANGPSSGTGSAPGGLYSFTIDPTSGKPVPLRSAESILGHAVADTDLLANNKTEALIQNNQLYGSSDATAYSLRQSARFNAAGVFTANDGTIYKIGGVVGGKKVSGSANGLVKLVDATAPGGFQLVKTAAMLTSRLRTGDGLPSLPIYAEVLLNNGVAPALVNAVYAANTGNGIPLTGAQWTALQADPRFIDSGNVKNFNPTSPTYRQLSGEPLIGDKALSIEAANNTTDFPKLAAIDQNVDGIPDVLRGFTAAQARPYLPQFASLTDAQLLAKLKAQTPINSEDWGAGQLLSHVAGGDWRANENIGLSTLHTMWAREHNFMVENLKASAKQFGVTGINDDDLFNAARILVEGEYQKLIYTEFAPSLAGTKLIDQGGGPHGWAGYNPNVDAGVSLEFSVASYRVGHSQIPQELIPGFGMFNAFLNPQLFLGLSNSAIEAGLVAKAHEAIDTLMTNGVRNELVTRNLDLFTANLLRGRELGLPGLNAIRAELYGGGPLNRANGTDLTASFQGNPLFKPYASWAEFGANLRDWVPAKAADGTAMAFNAATPSTYGSSALLAKFQSVYTNLSDIDAWVGMLAEKPAADTGQMGPLMAAIFYEQLDRAQEGDRFYYLDRLKNNGGGGLWSELDSLRDIVARNSDPALALPNKDIFKVQNTNDITLNRNGFINSAIAAGDQLRTVTNLFAGADPWATLQPFSFTSTPAVV